MISRKETIALLKELPPEQWPDGEYIVGESEDGLKLITWIPQLKEWRRIERVLNLTSPLTTGLQTIKIHIIECEYDYTWDVLSPEDEDGPQADIPIEKYEWMERVKSEQAAVQDYLYELLQK